MPQMAPMFWLILFVYFLGIFLLYIISTYYFFTPQLESNTKLSNFNVNSFNWSW